jgi:hypothetical protein
MFGLDTIESFITQAIAVKTSPSQGFHRQHGSKDVLLPQC